MTGVLDAQPMLEFFTRKLNATTNQRNRLFTRVASISTSISSFCFKGFRTNLSLRQLTTDALR